MLRHPDPVHPSPPASPISGRQHPDLEVEVIETPADAIRTVLRNGTAELALTYDLGLGADIDTEYLGVARPVRRTAARSPAGQTELHLARARRRTHGVTRSAGQPRLLRVDARQRRCEARIRYRSASYETVRGLVARGHGFSILNQEPAHHGTYDGGEVVAVPIRGDAPGLPIVIARAHVVRATARARAIEAAARTIFAEDGPR